MTPKKAPKMQKVPRKATSLHELFTEPEFRDELNDIILTAVKAANKDQRKVMASADYKAVCGCKEPEGDDVWEVGEYEGRFQRCTFCYKRLWD